MLKLVKYIKLNSCVSSIFLSGMLSCLLVFTSVKVYSSQKGKEIQVQPLSDTTALSSKLIQSAIDSCAAVGGGVVRLSKGKYLTGAIHLKNNVILHLDDGSFLKGSASYLDYGSGEWYEALIVGDSLTNIGIEGRGIIDGVNCYNPKGEEGFRGPHCIRLTNCSNISISGITILNSANWAINCRNCSHAFVENVSIRAGHDGLHTRFCSDFKVNNCDFRTGDDAFAGNDNKNFIVTNCKVNTSCNGFRFGCLNFIVKDCHLWGPGEYIHRISKRTNMLAAFTHFSPLDDHPKSISGNWLIQNLTIDNVDLVYYYNFENGLWQTGQPVSNLKFENIKATGILKAFCIIGDTARKLNLIVNNSSFSFRKGALVEDLKFEDVEVRSSAFFGVKNFNALEFHNVMLEYVNGAKSLTCNSGNSLVLDKVKYLPESNKKPLLIENVKVVKK
jgi:hypothetical protein